MLRTYRSHSSPCLCEMLPICQDTVCKVEVRTKKQQLHRPKGVPPRATHRWLVAPRAPGCDTPSSSP